MTGTLQAGSCHAVVRRRGSRVLPVRRTRRMSSIGTPRRDPVARSRPRSRRPPRRHLGPFVALVGLAAAVSAVIVAIRAHHTVPGVTVPLSNGRTLVLPATPGLSPLRARIVRLAESQIGYR